MSRVDPTAVFIGLILVALLFVTFAMVQRRGTSPSMQSRRIEERLTALEMSVQALAGDLRNVTQSNESLKRVLNTIVDGALESWAASRSHRANNP